MLKLIGKKILIILADFFCLSKPVLFVCFSEEEEEDPRHTRMCKAFTLGVAYAAITGGIATMTGAIPNLVFIGVLEA